MMLSKSSQDIDLVKHISISAPASKVNDQFLAKFSFPIQSLNPGSSCMMLLLYFLNVLNDPGMNPIKSIYSLYTCISDSKHCYNDIILEEVLQLIGYYEANVMQPAGSILLFSKCRRDCGMTESRWKSSARVSSGWG